jgi:Baculovirus VP1054 protein
MSSKKKPLILDLCASVKLTPYKPMRVPTRMQCWMHPRRVNCKVQHLRYGLSTDAEGQNDIVHLTVSNNIFLNERAKPYYRYMLRKMTDQAESRKTILNAENMYECVLIRPIRTETFRSIDEAGEHNMSCLKIIIDTVKQYLNKLTNDEYFLIVDKMYLDLIYSEFRAIVLPQHAYVIKGIYDDMNSDTTVEEGEEDAESTLRYPWNEITTINYISSTEQSRQSQYIYQTFLLYNTVLTSILKQSNPFDVVSDSTSISVIARNLGVCPQNKDRIKCCDLNYGCSPPGHIMCPPREIVKRVFHYAKWGRNPNNYRRYSELIVRSSTEHTDLHVRDRIHLLLLDWQNFMDEFSSYFGLPT